jgi:hypothetical protein
MPDEIKKPDFEVEYKTLGVVKLTGHNRFEGAVIEYDLSKADGWLPVESNQKRGADFINLILDYVVSWTLPDGIEIPKMPVNDKAVTALFKRLPLHMRRIFAESFTLAIDAVSYTDPN